MLLDLVQVSLMFLLKHESITIVFTKPYKSDYVGIMNLDAKAVQRIFIKLVRMNGWRSIKKLYDGKESKASVYRAFWLIAKPEWKQKDFKKCTSYTPIDVNTCKKKCTKWQL